MKQFLSDLKGGSLEPFILSEPIPETNDEPVKIAVAKNFDEIVTNNGKDTFIEFYAPWCSYCTDLAPVIDELGKTMLDEDVEIVKFDAIGNEIPKGFEVVSYPTFYWLGKKTKHRPVIYHGGKKLKDFVKYIAENATNKLKHHKSDDEVQKTEL